MGSFNVACSFSNISINSGDPVAFFPLTPNVYESFNVEDRKNAKYPQFDPRNKLSVPHHVQKTSNLIYSNCYYNLFSLPIIGTYDDYGGVEDIIEDENTKAIENYMGISIATFIKAITGRDLPDIDDEKLSILKSLSGCFVHGKLWDTFSKKGIGSDKIASAQMLRISFFEKIGFKHAGDDKNDSHHKHILTGHGVTIKIGNYGGVFTENNSSQFSKNANITDKLGIGKKVSLLKTGNPFYTMAGFKVAYKKLTDKDIDISYFQKTPTFYYYYDDIRKQLLDYKKASAAKPIEHIGFRGSITEQKDGFDAIRGIYKIETGDDYDTIMAKLTRYGLDDGDDPEKQAKELVKFVPYPEGEKFTYTTKPYYGLDPFATYNSGFFEGFFKSWDYFKPLYRDAILNNKLKADFNKIRNFWFSMYSTNRFFFPAMNGEQCGNDDASKAVLEASLKIVNARIKYFKEEDY